jgi:hypothetical protein
MIALLFQLIIAAIVCGVILYLINLVPGVAPFAQAIRVVVIAIFVIWLLYILFGMLGGAGGGFQHTPGHL